MGSGDVEEFDAHADTGLDDADDGEGFDGLVFSFQSDANPGVQKERTAGADEAAAQREVGSDAVGAGAGLEIEDFDIRGKGIANGIAAVANGGAARRRFCESVVHGNDVAHSR
jgi:hypothetical protein